MSDLDDLVVALFGKAWDGSATAFDAALWAQCEETGIARLTMPEAAGGSGGTLTDAASVLHAAGRFAARVPLVETDLLAGWLLHTAGIDVPDGPLSVAVAPDLRLDGDRATGTVARVPWGRDVAAVAVLAGDHVVLVDPRTAAITELANVAEEPRDTLVLDAATVAVAALPDGAAAEYPLRAALGRAMLLAGAGHAAVEMAVRYATERVQFGRPLSRLQAIQQSLATAAAEAAAAAAAAGAAARDVDAYGFAASATAIAAAKSRASAAAGTVARISHQVHGAIGMTREHDLRLVTTRLLAWRDEDGGEVYWDGVLGRGAIVAGGAGLWPMLTA